MRVGIISPYSLTLPGGVQGQVLGLARTLRRMDLDVRVLGPCDGPPPDAGVIPLGNSIPTAANGSVAPIAPDMAALLRTHRAIRDQCFDVIHLHEPLSPGPALFTLCWNPAPIVATFHAAGGSVAYDLLNPPSRWARTHIARAFAVSDDALQMASASLGGEYEVVFNGVEVAQYQRVRPLKNSDKTVFFVGRHEPRKGLAVLIEAMADLGPGVRLQIASDGPETDRLKAAAAGDQRIEWLGRISDAEKIARIKGADVFCAPSLHGESFGIVLLEAMAAGTSVVASDLPGYANVARGGLDADLVPPGDAGALAAALRRVLTDDAHAAALIESGRARADQFSMQRLAEIYRDAYRDVVAAEQRRNVRSTARRRPRMGEIA